MLLLQLPCVGDEEDGDYSDGGGVRADGDYESDGGVGTEV